MESEWQMKNTPAQLGVVAKAGGPVVVGTTYSKLLFYLMVLRGQ